MARTTPAQPGRIRQMIQVFQMTRRYDPAVVWLLMLAFVVPTALGVLAGFAIGGANLWVLIIWGVLGVMAGILATLILLGRRAERAAYGQIEGQPGAVGAVLRSGLRGGWIGQELPVAITRQQDALYRAVGRGGLVLIGEGDRGRVEKLLSDERRKLERSLPNVTIVDLHVGTAPGDLRLAQLAGRLRRMRNTLTKTEVRAINNRLTALASGLPIPKGIDPTKIRAPRGRMR